MIITTSCIESTTINATASSNHTESATKVFHSTSY